MNMVELIWMQKYIRSTGKQNSLDIYGYADNAPDI